MNRAEMEGSTSTIDTQEYFEELIDKFWKLCFAQCVEIIKGGDEKHISEVTSFITTIREPARHSKSKATGVRFATEEDVVVEQKEDLFDEQLFNLEFGKLEKSIENMSQEAYKCYKGSTSMNMALIRVYCELLNTFSPVIPVDYKLLQENILPECAKPDYELQQVVSTLLLKYLVKLTDNEQSQLLATFLVSIGCILTSIAMSEFQVIM